MEIQSVVYFGVLLFECHVHERSCINISIIVILYLLLRLHTTSFELMMFVPMKMVSMYLKIRSIWKPKNYSRNLKMLNWMKFNGISAIYVHQDVKASRIYYKEWVWPKNQVNKVNLDEKSLNYNSSLIKNEISCPDWEMKLE